MSTDSIQGWQHVANMAGVETEAVTTASKKLNKTMYNLENGAEKQTEAIGKLGLSYEDLESMSPDERMETLMEALQGVEDPAERLRIGTDLLGGSMDDLAPILDMTAEEVQDLRDKGEDLGMTLEELEEANAFRMEMEELKAELAATGRELAGELIPLLQEHLLPAIRDHLVPAIEAFFEKISILVDWFQGLSDNGKTLVLTLVGILASIGPLLVGISLAIKIFGILTTVAKVLAVVIGVITSPVGLVVIAILALIAIGVLLWKNWDTVKEKSIEIWGKIREFISDLVGNLKDWLVETFQKIRDGIGEKMESARAKISEIWNRIKTFFSDTLQRIRDNVSERFQAMRESISQRVQSMMDKIKEVWNSIKTFFSDILGNIWTTIKDKFDDIKTSIKEKIGEAKDNVIDGMNDALDFLKEIDLLQTGKDIIQGLINGIGSMVKAAGDKVKEVATGIKDGITGFFKVNSPSKVTTEIGGHIGGGLIVGMNDMEDKLNRQATSMSQAATPTAESGNLNTGNSMGSGDNSLIRELI
jgi:phage-related protein